MNRQGGVLMSVGFLSSFHLSCANLLFRKPEPGLALLEFVAYRKAFEKQNGEFVEEVTVVMKAAIKKSVMKMTTLKLGADFEVKVLNPEAKIEGGVDKKSGKKYYMLYYEG